MRFSQPLVDSLKRIPALRELAYMLRTLGTALANALHYSLTGKTYAAKHLSREFQEKPDPWGYASSPGNQERFQKTWDLVPDRPYRRILEIGCAEGHFTDQIAVRFPAAHVLAVDFMPVPLERAVARCAGRPNLAFRRLDVSTETLPGPFDLIFCMGALEYGPTLAQLHAIRDRILAALAPGGYLVLETQRAPAEFETRWWARQLAWGARALHDRFAVDGVTIIAEVPVYNEQRLLTLLRKQT